MTNSAPSPADIDAIKHMMTDWTDCLIGGDWAHWQTYWADDGVLMPPGHGRVVGHAQLVDYASLTFGTIGGYAFRDWTVEGDGSLAVVTNTIDVYDGPDRSGAPSASNNQMLLLRKNADGNWRVHKVIFNGDGTG